MDELGLEIPRYSRWGSRGRPVPVPLSGSMRASCWAAVPLQAAPLTPPHPWEGVLCAEHSVWVLAALGEA